MEEFIDPGTSVILTRPGQLLPNVQKVEVTGGKRRSSNKGYVPHLTHTEVLDETSIKKITPPTFTWLKDAQEWYK